MKVSHIYIFCQCFQCVRGEEVFTCCLVVWEAAEGGEKFFQGGRVVEHPMDGVVAQEVKDSRIEGNIVPGEDGGEPVAETLGVLFV